MTRAEWEALVEYTLNIGRQVQPHRKGKHGLLFGVVVPVALDFGKVLPGDVGLLVHGGIFQPPLVNEPQQPGGEALAKVVHQVFQTAGCPNAGVHTALPGSQCPMASQAAVSSCSPAA